MRRYKPDIMTALMVWLVAIGVLTTTSIFAQDNIAGRVDYPPGLVATCRGIPGNDALCLTGYEIVQNMKNSPVTNKLWQPYHLSSHDGPVAKLFVALREGHCSGIFQDSSSTSTDAMLSDLKIGLPRYLIMDFEMEDVSRLEFSRIYVGIKDCW
jgi:hypothetical protein